MTIAPPTDRAGVELRIGQRVRAATAWGEVEGMMVGMKCSNGRWWIWIVVDAMCSHAMHGRIKRVIGEYNETMVRAGECEVQNGSHDEN